MRDIKKYSENYQKQDFEVYQVEYRRKKVLEQIEKYNPQVILEIGCGSEPLFLYTPNKEWTIVEPSGTFCEIAKEKSENYNVNIIQGFLEEQFEKLDKKAFDMIVCSGLLHEVEDPRVMLSAIYKLCEKETVVHINVPNAKSIHRLLARYMNIASEYDKSERNILLEQATIFDMDIFANLVTECGFEIMDRGSYFVKPFTHAQMWMMMEKEIINKNVLDGLYKLVEDIPAFGSEIYLNCKKQN